MRRRAAFSASLRCIRLLWPVIIALPSFANHTRQLAGAAAAVTIIHNFLSAISHQLLSLLCNIRFSIDDLGPSTTSAVLDRPKAYLSILSCSLAKLELKAYITCIVRRHARRACGQSRGWPLSWASETCTFRTSQASAHRQSLGGGVRGHPSASPSTLRKLCPSAEARGLAVVYGVKCVSLSHLDRPSW